jgi:hypothetical protein
VALNFTQIKVKALLLTSSLLQWLAPSHYSLHLIYSSLSLDVPVLELCSTWSIGLYYSFPSYLHEHLSHLPQSFLKCHFVNEHLTWSIPVSLPCLTFLFLFLFSDVTGVWTQGLMLARQVFYYLRHCQPYFFFLDSTCYTTKYYTIYLLCFLFIVCFS